MGTAPQLKIRHSVFANIDETIALGLLAKDSRHIIARMIKYLCQLNQHPLSIPDLDIGKSQRRALVFLPVRLARQREVRHVCHTAAACTSGGFPALKFLVRLRCDDAHLSVLLGDRGQPGIVVLGLVAPGRVRAGEDTGLGNLPEEKVWEEELLKGGSRHGVVRMAVHLLEESIDPFSKRA